MKEKWKKALTLLQNDFPEDYNLWFIQLEYKKFIKTSQTLVLSVTSETTLNIIQQRFYDVISSYCEKSYEQVITIKLIVLEDSHLFKSIKKKPLIKEEKAQKISKYFTSILDFNKKFTFERFVSGDHSDLAFKAAQLIANQKDGDFSRFNPFFIHGGVGLGKTHLIQSIGNYILQHSPNLIIRYVTAEKYLNDYIEANITRNFQGFRDYYRNVNILMVDDIQFLENKEKIQDEIFNNFNKLYQNNQQIILTCDKHPKELKNVQERLISRFSWGLTVDIKPPDIKTRKNIFIQKMTEENMIHHLNDEIINFLAENITQNIRDIESAVTKINSIITLTNRPITLELIKNELENLLTPIKAKNMNINILQIQQVVAEYYNVTIAELKSKKRNKHIAFPRHIAIYLCKEIVNLSLSKIGDEFGNRDHSTILTSVKKIDKEIKINSSVRSEHEYLLKKITTL